MADSAAGLKRKEADPANGSAGKRGRWDAAPTPPAANGAPAGEAAGKPSQGGAKPGLVSLDALAKAKRALQMQKELNEKLKKLPQLQKKASTAATGPEPPAPSSVPPTSAPSPMPMPTAASIAAAAAAAGLPVTAPPVAPVAPPPAVFPGLAASAILPFPGAAAAPGVPLALPGAAVPAVAPGLGALMPGLPGALPVVPTVPAVPGVLPAPAAPPKPSAKALALRLDALGREIDEEGNVIERPKAGPVSTLKVNINKAKKEAFKILHPELEPEPEESPFYDPRMQATKKKLVRQRRASFQFVEEGREARKAEIMRVKAHFGDARAREAEARRAAQAKEQAAVADAEGEEVNPNLVAVGLRVPAAEDKKREPIPSVEWWDALILNQPASYTGSAEGDPGEGGAEAVLANIKESKITLYVEHPVPIEPPAEPQAPPPQPLRLTKRERKKLRTQKRVAREKERQEMVRQGLLDPPKAKVKMSNLMKVLASEATQDPTKMEKEVRAAAAEREQAHVDRNLARMLTPAERKEKKERKLFEDGLLGTGGETFVSVFKVRHLQHPQTRYKVDINAQENRLTGCAVLADEFCLVIVEGGQKAIKRYTKLMTRRINWAAAKPAGAGGGDEEDDDAPANWCQEVWQGSVAKATFTKFTIEQCRNSTVARKFLQDRGVAHYWDAALSFKVD